MSQARTSSQILALPLWFGSPRRQNVDKRVVYTRRPSSLKRAGVHDNQPTHSMPHPDPLVHVTKVDVQPTTPCYWRNVVPFQRTDFFEALQRDFLQGGHQKHIYPGWMHCQRCTVVVDKGNKHHGQEKQEKVKVLMFKSKTNMYFFCTIGSL